MNSRRFLQKNTSQVSVKALCFPGVPKLKYDSHS